MKKSFVPAALAIAIALGAAPGSTHAATPQSAAHDLRTLAARIVPLIQSCANDIATMGQDLTQVGQSTTAGHKANSRALNSAAKAAEASCATGAQAIQRMAIPASLRHNSAVRHVMIESYGALHDFSIAASLALQMGKDLDAGKYADVLTVAKHAESVINAASTHANADAAYLKQAAQQVGA